MAVVKRGSVREYRAHYMRRLTLLLLLPIAFSLGLGGLVDTLLTMFHQREAASLIIHLASLTGGIIGTLIAIPLIARPMQQLLDTAAYHAGELTAHPPVNTADPAHEKSGLSTVLNALHGTTGDTETLTHSAPSIAHIALQALDRSNCGIVVMDSAQRIIFATAHAPVITTPSGEQELALEFIDEQSVSDWLTTIHDRHITATRQWCRIPADRRLIDRPAFYDISASYEKGAAGETLLVFFDRSYKYAPEEEDLNFIAFAAHELRGPITVIRGYLDILEQELGPRLQGDEPQLLDRLIVSAGRLSGYVNNILNVARFDRHHLKVHLQEDSIAAIYASIADDMQLRATTQHRLLSVNIPENLPTVAADRGSISEVISNLIDNAIKYSFEGGVVRVMAAAKGEFIEVTVEDNGIGMPASVVSNLFRKFYRSHRSREAVAGTGIGLYICKAFIESHGGTIAARSKENEGSTFSFTIPIYATIQDKLLDDGQLNQRLIRTGDGWIQNHTMYRN